MGMFDWLFGFEDIPRPKPQGTYGPNPEAVALIAEVRQLMKDHKVTGCLGKDYPILADRYMVSMMQPHYVDNYFTRYEGERGGWRSCLSLREYGPPTTEFQESCIVTRDEIRSVTVVVYVQDFTDLNDMDDLVIEMTAAAMEGEIEDMTKAIDRQAKRDAKAAKAKLEKDLQV